MYACMFHFRLSWWSISPLLRLVAILKKKMNTYLHTNKTHANERGGGFVFSCILSSPEVNVQGKTSALCTRGHLKMIKHSICNH